MSEYYKSKLLKKELEQKSQALEQKLKRDAGALKSSASKAAMKGAAIGLGVVAGLAIVKLTLSKSGTKKDKKEATEVKADANEQVEEERSTGKGDMFKARLKAALIAILLEVSKQKVTEIVQKSFAQPQEDNDTEQSN